MVVVGTIHNLMDIGPLRDSDFDDVFNKESCKDIS